MRIAIVAYDFPPFNSGGSQRPWLLAKFLSSQGVEVVVFTLHVDSYPARQLNYTIAKEFQSKIAVVRCLLKKESAFGKIFQSYYFNLVDTIGARWRKELERAIEREHAKNSFDYVLSTCPPFSLAPLGVYLSKKIKVPLILDMRDAWSQWVTAPYATYFHYRGVLNLEGEALRHASFITYTSEQQKIDWLNIHSDLESKKFIYMPNGFENYKESIKEANKEIRIFYSGSFYYNPESDRLINNPWYTKKPYQYLQYLPRVEEWKYRSPYFFFRIVKELIRNSPDLQPRIKIRFAGFKPYWYDQMVAEFGLQNQNFHAGFLNKDQVDEELKKADYFLLTSSKVKEGRDYSVAGKTFEYFSFKKPIIGVVCEGEQKDILEKSGLSIVLNPDDATSSAEKLRDFLLNDAIKPDWDFIDQFRVPNNYANVVSALKTEI